MKRNIFLKIRRIIYTICAKISFFDRNDIAVFCYHALGNDTWQFSSSVDVFKAQIEYLLKTRKPITAEELLFTIRNGKKVTGKRFLITFDDGYKDILQIASFLKSKKIKPVVFVLSDTKHAKHSELENNREFLSKKEILHLRSLGWTIGCHSATHADFAKLSTKTLQREIIDSKSILEKELHIPIEYFAYPKGRYSTEVFEAVKTAQYKMAFSVDGDVINQNTDIYRVPRNGIDRSHTIEEFGATYSLPVIYLRKLIKVASISYFSEVAHHKIENIMRDINLFIETPIEYLYSYTFSARKRIWIDPYSPETTRVARELYKKLKVKAPKLKLYLVGSASLKIAGQKDIDLLASCDPKLFDTYLPQITKLLGKPTKRRPDFLEWHTKYKNYDVQFMILNPDNRIFRELYNTYNVLKNKEGATKQYQRIKLISNGVSEREYKRRRLEFFNQISA